MLLEDSAEECQKDELVALKSMYGEDLKNYPKRVPWRNWCPLNLRIALAPTKEDHRINEEVYVELVLHIECSEDYPKKAPNIYLEDVHGLPESAKKTLEAELAEKAKEYEGDVMIYLLAIHVQEFLLSHNKPANKKSCFDEMVDAQARKMQQECEANRQEEDRKRQEILREIKEMNENDSDESAEEVTDHFEKMALESANLRKFDSINYDESKCNHGTKTIRFSNNGGREIQRGKCFDHRCSENCILYSGVDKKTFQIVFLTEWNIIVQKNDQIRVKSEINRIKKELLKLKSLDHINLCKYLDVHMEYSKDKQKYSVFLIQEFTQGSTLTSIFFRNFVSCGLPLLQRISTGILQALEYLHSNDVTCKELDPSQIYIDHRGSIKLCTYSLNAQFDNLICEDSCINNNFTKQNDILNCGKLLLALLTGDKYTEDIPRTVPASLQDFLNTCFGSQGAENQNATELLKHPFITSDDVGQQELLFEHHSDPDNNEPFQQPCQAAMLQSSHSMHLQPIGLIGQGAFGKVIKVRNAVDKNFYALKKIKFKPNDQKLMQEVALLSALNHENVVRYFTSWIEDDYGPSSLFEDGESEDEEETSENVSISLKDSKQSLEADIAKLTPGLQIDFSEIGEDNYNSSGDDMDIYEEEDSSDYDSSSDAIEFEQSPDKKNVRPDSAVAKVSSKMQPEYKVLCIQMEFCERSTLRSAIDDNLHLNKDRVWRLFREIVDGLMYIHQQKLIHRDLKPMNIFLDSKDHVKIGDFGLATTTLLTSNRQKEINIGSNELLPMHESGTITGTGIDLSMTGHVGSSYYIAPEIINKAKTKYNEKVDIYSLGVIFFEMCYRPINTGMERATILKELRHKNIKIPDDFEESPKQNMCAQKQVIKLLLNHDPIERPTCEQLLQSEHVPPPVGAEAQRQQLIDQLFTHTKSKEYKYLLTSCFKPRTAVTMVAQSVWYSLPSNHRTDAAILERWLLMLDSINTEFTKIFKLHGYYNLATPLLLSRNKYYDNTNSCVKLMMQNGFIVSVPHDLRLPFAQYLGRNGFTNLRRFTIERVYRERKVCMPREFYECAYDIVSPTLDYMNDVEIIGILGEIINQVPAVRKKKIVLRLNHKLLIHAILLHFGVKEKDLNDSTSKCLSFYDLKFRSKLLNQPDGWKIFTAIHNFIQKEYPIDKMTSSLQIITNGKTIAAQYATKALNELRQIIEFVKYFEVPFEMVVSLRFWNNAHQYSGMICQLSYEYQRKGKRDCEILAEGGRFDSLVSEHRCNLDQQQYQNQHVVGMTVFLEQLVKMTQKYNNNNTATLANNVSCLDVVVCSLGNSTLTHVKIEVLRRLLSAKIRSRIIDVSDILDINNKCSRLNVQYAIIIKDSPHTVTVHSVDHDIRDKKVTVSELIDYMISELRGNGKEELYDQFSAPVLKSESKSSFSMDKIECTELDMDIYFIDDKRNYKKRLETQIRGQVKTLVTGKIVIISLPIDRKEWNNIYPMLNLESDKNLDDYMFPSTCKNMNKLRKEIMRLRHKNMPMIIVHGSRDSSYHVLV